nr:hypothetical protein [uncultured Mucilaginibacter sp.]
MQALDSNRKLIDGYLELFKNLSSSNKLELISGLADSLNAGATENHNSLSALVSDFIPEKSADVIIDELKAARSFTRDTDAF